VSLLNNPFTPKKIKKIMNNYYRYILVCVGALICSPLMDMEPEGGPRGVKRPGEPAEQAEQVQSAKRRKLLYPFLSEGERAQGETPLHTAVIEGNLARVQELLRAGADVNARATQGETPLHLAAALGDAAIARELINHGADLNAQDSVQFTPLHRAAMNDHVGVMELLLDAGADIGARAEGRSPLSIAMRRPDLDPAAIRLLLRYGAITGTFLKRWIASTDMLSELQDLAITGSPEKIEQLMAQRAGEGAPVTQEELTNALAFAAGNGRRALVGVLLRHGAEPYQALHVVEGILRRIESLRAELAQALAKERIPQAEAATKEKEYTTLAETYRFIRDMLAGHFYQLRQEPTLFRLLPAELMGLLLPFFVQANLPPKSPGT
jgi:ankyrin repeat protein